MTSLVQNIISASQVPDVDTKIYRYICLSIAALAIQTNKEGVINSVLS